ncbi:MAG: hypothetical protein JJT88_20915 [Gammaproteobacteria bacterium]|nr:hypothetical protein [Gammaproteobacteria bacterium]
MQEFLKIITACAALMVVATQSSADTFGPPEGFLDGEMFVVNRGRVIQRKPVKNFIDEFESMKLTDGSFPKFIEWRPITRSEPPEGQEYIKAAFRSGSEEIEFEFTYLIDRQMDDGRMIVRLLYVNLANEARMSAPDFLYLMQGG